MDPSSLVLGLRVTLALACVLGLMWFMGRRLSGSAAVKRQRTTSVAVLAKQSLGQKAGVALVEVAGRRLLLGVSEHGVTMLTEIEVLPEPVVTERVERVELDPSLLELELNPPAGSTYPSAPRTYRSPGSTLAIPDDASSLVPLSTPAARMPAVPKPRNPLEGSILDAATWRQAVVAVQERTIRR